MKLISSRELVRTSIFWVTDDVAIAPDGFEIRRLIIRK